MRSVYQAMGSIQLAKKANILFWIKIFKILTSFHFIFQKKTSMHFEFFFRIIQLAIYSIYRYVYFRRSFAYSKSTINGLEVHSLLSWALKNDYPLLVRSFFLQQCLRSTSSFAVLICILVYVVLSSFRPLYLPNAWKHIFSLLM